MTALVVVAPTDAQLAYIAGLCEERGLEPPAAVYSKADASCAGRGSQFHHVLPRSRGGRNHISNGLWVCLYCRTFIHAHPRLARERGWLAGSAS